MSKSSEKNPVLTENNDRFQSKKRRRSSSPDTAEELSPKISKLASSGKRWKGTTSAEFQPELLEEMGVSMLPGVSEEDKSITEIFLSSSEDNENVNSNLSKRKKILKRKKKKRQSLNYLGLRNSEKSLIGCLNNNSPVGEKSLIDNPSKIVSTNLEKDNLSDVPGMDSDSEDCSPHPKDDSDDCCILDSCCEDSSTKENSKNLKWEKLKPINCKIRNSKIIYQNELTVIEKDSERDVEKSRAKVEQVRKNKGERRVKDQDDSDFFLCRRSKIEVSGGEDHFNKLSDEVILSILRWLPKKSLVTCAVVCKRFLRLAYDEALWTRMDLGGRNLPPKSVGYIVSRGFRILRLAQAALPDPVFCPSSTVLPPDFVCKLQYLDLSMASISANGLAVFLNFCKFLKKLSLENCHLNNSCCTAIGQNTDLEVLNLTMCVGLTTSGVDSILSNCRRLQSLNISWTGLSVPSLDVVVCKVPSKLERLNISGSKSHLTNEQKGERIHQNGMNHEQCYQRELDENTMVTKFGETGLLRESFNLHKRDTNESLHIEIKVCAPDTVELKNRDLHVIEIFHRCENLIELDVSDSIELTDEVINYIVKYVKKIEYLSFSRCYSINTSSFLLLKHVESLMFLDVFGLMTDQELNELKSGITDVSVNQFPFSSVARPTVGLRRTSIWGLRVRD